jgi:hypothetical protein
MRTIRDLFWWGTLVAVVVAVSLLGGGSGTFSTPLFAQAPAAQTNETDDDDDGAEDQEDDDGDFDDDDDGDEVEVEGTASELSGNCPTLTFVVNGTRVTTDGSTRFDTGCAAVQNGQPIEVEGTLLADGSLSAAEVELEDD